MPDGPDSFAFFNGLSIVLRIELDPPATQVSQRILNLIASPEAIVRSVLAEARRFDQEYDTRALTEAEWARVVRPPSGGLSGGRDLVRCPGLQPGVPFPAGRLGASFERLLLSPRGSEKPITPS